MDIESYIKSGLIEGYVLGIISAEERNNVELMAAQHSEIKAAIRSFEEILEKKSQSSVIAAPFDLKNKIMDTINSQSDLKKKNLKQSNAAIPITAMSRGVKWLRGTIAACIIVLMGSIILNFYYYSRFKKYNAQYAEMLNKQNALVQKNNRLEASVKMLRDPAMKPIPMHMMPDKNDIMATVYWNGQNKMVYLMASNLPNKPSNMQYQLWAIVDGKPINAGMIDTRKNDMLIAMKEINNADAFAITLEPMGGSATPQGNMLAMGKV